MFDFITEWKLKRKLAKKLNRSVSDSYINEQRRLYQKRYDSNATTIDTLNYMLINDIFDLSESKHSNKEVFNSATVEFKSKYDDNDSSFRHSSNHSDSYYGGGGGYSSHSSHSSHDSGGSSGGGD